MTNLFVVLVLAASLGLLYAWAFRALPAERWQVLASLPWQRRGPGRFKGVNLTWYGVFTAAGAGLAAALFLFLAAAFGVALPVAAGLLASFGLCGFAASRWTARLVEGRKHTASVGGGLFVTFWLVPAVLTLVERTLVPGLPKLELLAAAALAYVLGEAVGRLACISFGCCYGKPMAAAPPLFRWLLGRRAFHFQGPNRKIAYASGLEGVAVLPVQAITALVLTTVGLLGLWLLLAGWPRPALVVAIVGSQLWRAFSETLRADHRGGGRLSAYQWMALMMALATALAVGLPGTWWPAGASLPADVERGLAALWQPAVLLGLQALVLAAMLWSGLSQVTGAHLRIRTYRSRALPR